MFVKGVIDLLFEEDEPQVAAYAHEWEKTFGYRLKEAGLYFINMQKYVRL